MNLNPFQNNNDNNMENINNIINKKRTLMIDLKGEPGKNCGGFCRFCYFRKVDNTNIYPLGCRNCTFQIGCDYCTYSVREINGDFIPLSFAIQQIQNGLFFQRYDKINITSGGDVSYYPYLRELCEYIKNLNLKIHLGYTSGKGFTYELAKYLIDLGMDEITFSVFATNEDLRKKWMNDKNPKESLKCLEYFCNNCETHCAIIMVPGVNDGKVLYDTLKNLSEWGAKATILMRFANYEYQGLILKNEKIVEGIEPHTLDEFKNIVDFANNNFGNDMRITGTPLYDPITKAPFALVNYERIINDLKNSVECESTIITGNVSYPFLKKIFDETPVNVVRVNKDISDLITKEDLESIDLKMVSDTVIIPPKAFVHDRVAEEIFNRDGGDRIVIRGVDRLTLDGEVSSEYTKEEVLNFERTAFNELIEKINFFGKRVR